ncbi:S8 family peptidase [Microbacterium sp. SD291]|uniref:S8 family peptidase n=1 Tax=Microbacterium sp. SD291 TaxID=2782007 RepID=UPI001A96EF2D|nr:S8 family peptidase [Microbacterium sp. SD291]MBO0981310.1 S8 family peptidase [Microbacterium sp. SD291]
MFKKTPWRNAASRGAATAAALLTCTAIILTPSFAGANTDSTGDPEIVGASSANAIPGEYIVVLKPSGAIGTADDVSATLTDEVGGQVLSTFNTVLNGYSALLTEDEALTLSGDDRVDYVEQSQTFYALDEQVSPPNWGDDRIDQRDLPLDQSYTYPGSAGEGVHVYIVDTGVRASHADFAGRMGPGFDAVTPGGSANDCNGHGTHVAGTAAGTKYGVAKKATIHPVRILNCEGSGSSTDIIEAIEWLTENAQKPATANYSVGCRTACSSPATDQAVKNLVASGVTWVQAAGNSNDDACRYSPQLVPEGITVGNSTRTDGKAASSSWGSCLDVWAPGTDIVSAWYTADDATRSATGTSMASPHTTGATALYLGENPDATPAQVQAAIKENATTGTLTGLDAASPNRLLYTGFLNSDDPAPVAVDLAAIGNQSGKVGQAVNLAVSATGGTAPYAFSATGLPAGLAISASTGAITGTPTAAATSNVTVTVKDAGTPVTTDSASFTFTITAVSTSSCDGTPVSSGSLTNGQQVVSPTFTCASGAVEVCLDGPTGADFDVYLQKNYSWFGWITVAEGTSADADEKFTYNAGAGSYRVVVKSYSGSGAYTATVK